MSSPFRLLLIGDSDSQLLASEALCQFPDHLKVDVTINAIPRDGTPETILQRAQTLFSCPCHSQAVSRAPLD